MADESKNHDGDTADDDKLMRTVDLIHQRAQGRVSNAQLERAVAELLHQKPVVLDMENYDDDSDSDDGVQKEPQTNDTKVAASTDRVPPTRTTRSQKAETGPSQLQTTATGVLQDESATSTINWELYQDIPLGRQGAQMMTTFGDGKIPHPTVVRKTLQGARRMLITAIQDARHYRHQQSVQYRTTKKTIQKFQIAHDADPEIVFRAQEGYDHYARIPKCGFSEDDLRVLYPGTMNEFERWNNMQAEADAKDAAKSDHGTMALEEEPDDDDNNDDQQQQQDKDDDDDDSPPQPAPGLCGHLRDRAENFDLRTDKMNAPWYLKYSVLRQGSFLPPKRRGRTTNATNDTVWEQNSRTNKKTGWHSMTASAVRFLHWVGFDPESALPPPNEATTSALAFLCYDFFGRIVEKAIYLRLQQQTLSHVKKQRVDHDDDTLELPPGQQLREEDIDAAMECPDIKAVSLYSASSSASESKQQQLYFGPGFEDRLELELEEMVGGGGKQNQLSAQELERRRVEDALFSKLAETPVTEDGVAVLVSKLKKKPAKKKRSSQKRKRVPRKATANEFSDEGSDGDYVEGE